MSEQSVPESGVLRVRVTEDFELDGGAWKPAGEQKGWLIATVPDLAAHVRNSWPADRLERDSVTAGKHGIRVIANTVTHISWRNGPVENVHAGRFQGYGLDRRACSRRPRRRLSAMPRADSQPD